MHVCMNTLCCNTLLTAGQSHARTTTLTYTHYHIMGVTGLAPELFFSWCMYILHKHERIDLLYMISKSKSKFQSKTPSAQHVHKKDTPPPIVVGAFVQKDSEMCMHECTATSNE